MKKILFLASLAALALTSCTSESNEYAGSKSEQKEIAFFPVTQPTTRAAVQSAKFPEAQHIFVAARQVAPVAEDYFGKTIFSKGTTYWEGSQKRYWPLATSTINFLAVTGIADANTDQVSFPATGSSPGTANIASASVAYTSANSYDQNSQLDIMYAVGQGKVTQTNNSLSFPANVPMTFYHALAMINFQVKAFSTVEEAITINNIKLNGVKYTGSLVITNDAKYSTEDAQVKPTVAWTGDTAPTGDNRPTVPNVPTHPTYNVYNPANTTVNTSGSEAEGNAWACLMVVPDEIMSFTINYSYDGHTYDYTYYPSGTTGTAYSLTAGNKYTYQITFKLHEILINPQVDPWDTHNTDNSVNIF